MAEIKHTFTAGKMNKDLDERLVKNGEYRDALNIQVRTSDGDASGTAQNTLGNSKFADVHRVMNVDEDTVAVGSARDESRNKAYFFFAGPKVNLDFQSYNRWVDYFDLIYEQDSNGSGKFVCIDIYDMIRTYEEFGSPTVNGEFHAISNVGPQGEYRVGMNIMAVNSSNNNLFRPGTKIKDIQLAGGRYTIYLDREQECNMSEITHFRLYSDRVLNFDPEKVLPAIDVLDDFLFWTDNVSEPKKINIKRGIAGTSQSSAKHSKLMLEDAAGNLKEAKDVLENINDSWLKEEHITVIRKSPLLAPNLDMSASTRAGVTSYVFNSLDVTSWEAGQSITLAEVPNNIDWRVGDTLSLESVDTDGAGTAKIQVTETFGTELTATVLSVSSSLDNTYLVWEVTLDEKQPMFSRKFPRFAYRYKYEDNEYSSFSPWSELAFLPGEYDYEPKKAYNLGMENQVRQLSVKDFVVDEAFKPDDVKAIEILYKTTDSPVVYVVKEIVRNKGQEWDLFSDNGGELVITSEMIHKAVESNQILRAWDNVPRQARAQAITANRLVYGNYVQGYDITGPVTLEQSISSKDVDGDVEKSVKSLRTYKWGMVFGDKYGRETPVVGTGSTYYRDRNSISQSVANDVYVGKELSAKANSFKLKQNWATPNRQYFPDSWMDYVRYYVKETSNEYYNLVMDRWYDAEDGNVWISFESADRNKVDIETYLILKKENGSDIAVTEEARFKIIAIENEAPDFIKQQHLSMGTVEMSLYTDHDSDNTPDFVDRVYFELPALDFGSFVSPSSFRGTPMLRVVAVMDDGRKLYTKPAVITRFVAPEDGDAGSMNIDRAFGNSGDLANRAVALGYFNGNIATAVNDIDYQFEFTDRVLENKPEFDGRFFVKIERNSTTDQKVLNILEGERTFNVVDQVETRYVETSTQSNPAPDNATHLGPHNTDTGNDLLGYFSGNNEFFEFGRCNQDYDTRNFWRDFGTGWFLDNATQGNVATGLPNNWGVDGGNQGGLSMSLTADNNTYDRIAFGYRAQVLPTEELGFKAHMLQPGRVFRFADDPNGNMYKIVAGQDEYNNVYNYSDNFGLFDGSCENCSANENPESCKRVVFRTTFRRLDSLGNETNEGIDINTWDPRGQVKFDGSGNNRLSIELLEVAVTDNQPLRSNGTRAAVFETEPKEDVGLDIYYEASNSLPLKLDARNISMYAPKDATIDVIVDGEPISVGTVSGFNEDKIIINGSTVLRGDTIAFNHANGTTTYATVGAHFVEVSGVAVPGVRRDHTAAVTEGSNTMQVFTNPSDLQAGMQITGPGIPERTKVQSISGGYVTMNNEATSTHAMTTGYRFYVPTTIIGLNPNVWQQPIELGWFNCYSFGNGVESDRIRDDFNTPTIDNGVAASSTVTEYGEERRGSSLIYSGLYNSNSGVNNLNEFNMAEKITKDINPIYGSVQALMQRDVDLITFLEDKVGNILANKDALYNADGKANLTATDRVLGQFVPYAGDYGISTNPESLAKDEFRCYFTDKARGAVLRLSKNGITPISDVGMRTYFRDNLKHCKDLVGTFDKVNGEYNLSMHAWANSPLKASTTVTFNEAGKGWVSFKSFVARCGETVDGTYMTAPKSHNVWKHYDKDVARNNFYGEQYNSSITLLLNDNASSVKRFNNLSYEGSQSRVVEHYYELDIDAHAPNAAFKSTNPYTGEVSNTAGLARDYEYYNQEGKNGWYASSVKTDLESGHVDEFINKENKWFNFIKGNATTLGNLDTSDFTVEGIGRIRPVLGAQPSEEPVVEFTITIKDDPDE